MIKLSEYIDLKEIDKLDGSQQLNMFELLYKINLVRISYGRPMTVSSGYRSPGHNILIGGAKNSWHVKCGAIDIADPKKELQKWIINNVKLIKDLGLQVEDFKFTPNWVHLDIARRHLVNTIFFKPY